jgi:hypothetical protein
MYFVCTGGLVKLNLKFCMGKNLPPNGSNYTVECPMVGHPEKSLKWADEVF